MNNASPENNFDLEFADIFDSPNSIFADKKALSPEDEKYVVFHLDEKIYAVHSRQVAEIVGALAVTPLPNVPEWLAGIANLRGDIISVIDLRKLWKKKNSAAPAKPKMIVLRSAKFDAQIALVVDKLNELVSLPAKEIEFSAADFEMSFPTFFGRAAFKSDTLFLLDTEHLLASLEF